MGTMCKCLTLPLSHRRFLSPKPPNFSTTQFPRFPSKINNGNFRVVTLRASFDNNASSNNNVGISSALESDKLPSELRKRAMEAVDACGGRVTVGDVASKSGLNLSQSHKALQALAADSNGFLEVSDEGDILYVLPKDLSLKLAARSRKMKFESLVEKAKDEAGNLLRASFGAALIASVVIVYATIMYILVRGNSDSDKESGERKRHGSSSLNSITIPFPEGFHRHRNTHSMEDNECKNDDGLNFIESVFSVVFGDGNPNQNIEEERWKLIGKCITSNGGIVAAEELAPYLDFTPTEAIMNDESYLLPVLLRFDGHPKPDEEGNILYQFPSLQRTASCQRNGIVGKRWVDWVGGVAKFLKEEKWQFSKTSILKRAMVFGLGGLNLSGVIILGILLKEIALTSSGYIQAVAVIFPLLQIYAGSFFLIPLIRWFLIFKRNADIESRNRAREQHAAALETLDLSLRRKVMFMSARDMAQRTIIGWDRIIYRTDKNLFDQDYEAQDWDRRLKAIGKPD